MQPLRYGVAYYDEYMPYDRLAEDIAMMQAAGINTVRIAESTWSTLEPQSGVFDFRSIDRVLAAMHAAGIAVIIGTPTYAVPTWLVKAYPDVLATTPAGLNQYGPRQNMDITHPAYLYHAERVIRRLLAHVSHHPAVIGYQADNETKHYHTCGAGVQLQFVKYMRERFQTLENLNHRLGLDYWSNRINSWEDFPPVTATINGSLKSEFARFQRLLVTRFLAWQVDLIRAYKRPDQFITQNFDFEWRGYSYGIQPDVDHFAAAVAFDIAGVDIYHPSQKDLTGIEIAFGGDVARSLKRTNYLVLETQAQAFPNWTPYPGQLRLQAFSHVASGASMVAYWHFHSIHNSYETYWKGLLSHDLGSNPAYEEARTIGYDFQRLGARIGHLQICNNVAILVSNEALTALEAFHDAMKIRYNDIVRAMYDALYRQNISCDFVHPDSPDLESYRLLVVPSLYAAPDALLDRLNAYVHNGGYIVYGLRSGFADETVKVRPVIQPGRISEACGVTYSQFVYADRVSLRLQQPATDGLAGEEAFDPSLQGFMELLTPGSAQVLAWYEHPWWGQYAAITQNTHGYGQAFYIGCQPGPAVYEQVLARAARAAGVWGPDQQLRFPLITRKGRNQAGQLIRYYFNYADQPAACLPLEAAGTELLSGQPVAASQPLHLDPWGLRIVAVD